MVTAVTSQTELYRVHASYPRPQASIALVPLMGSDYVIRSKPMTLVEAERLRHRWSSQVEGRGWKFDIEPEN